MMNTRRWQDFNLYLMISVLVLLGFGTAMVYSTTIGNNYRGDVWSLSSPFARHFIWIGIGAGAMLFLTLFDYHNLQIFTRPLYIFMLLLLGYTLLAGKIASGAQSWLLGESSGQPSEPAKLLLIISLAAWWANHDEQGHSWFTLGGSLLLAGAPLLLVLLQPDLGTAMVIGVMWLAMAWAAGMTWKQAAVLLMIAIPVLYIGWNYVLEPYQQGRLLAFTMTRDEIEHIKDPKVYDAVARVFYNVDASKVAVGNGGLTGQGLLNGIQSQRNFLPVQYTDFIFAVTAEELGFVGAATMLGFICLVLWQAVSIAYRAKDTFGRLIAVGIFAMLLIHTYENVGMNMGMMPVTGIPLPFISYGGSFTVTVLAAVGLLQSISLRHRSLTF
ncbi:MAG TPA: FtsW/RodA/SpoVE family cell cycle protein [Herpetosiphonaceae bacterium]